MRFRHKNNNIYWIVAWVSVPEFKLFGKSIPRVYIYCKDQTGNPYKFEEKEILRYE